MATRRNKKRNSKTKKERARKKAVSSKKKIAKKKRDLTRTPGLEKRLFSRIKQEYHDIDEYSFELGGKDKVWLSQFMEEHLGANLKEENMVNKYNRKPLHKTKKAKQACYNANNARQRDTYSLAKATGKFTSEDLDISEEKSREDFNFEDNYLTLLEAEPQLLTKEEFLDLRGNMTADMIEFYTKYYDIK